ncbi:hypothetical protein Elgi_36310 [Paenibacillus elgii]|uniref:N-acetylmuramoyl-L-alanine amidase n=1 Tax=Paenibacillus elgii TaxID=189691 RepID=UPI002D7DE887|nr:hypothetical protein Elgi_36310 [Paenibacillus elgii]
MTFEVKWKGNDSTNWSERKDSAGISYVPFIIVNHISAGTMSSMDNWFTSPNNNVSSAHFGVSKDGRIHQYVDIRKMAWANGSYVDNYPTDPAPVLADMKHKNCNLYSVSIEHEGTDGNLTDIQFQASVWLHHYIREQIMEIWGKEKWFPFDEYHVLGHFQIAKNKPSCPGKYFPWNQLYKTLKEENKGDDDEMKLELWQWTMLGDAITGLSQQVQTNGEPIISYEWAEKAYKQEMTSSEALFMVMVSLARAKGITVELRNQ